MWSAPVVVTETSEFEEPILVYPKGSLFNLYQILMNVRLPFNYRAAGKDEFDILSQKVAVEKEEHQVRKDRIAFNEHRSNPSKF